MIMKYKILNIFTLLLFLPLCVAAQRVAEVSATYTYEVSEDANITFGDAKRRCIELAKAAAIKAEFGELCQLAPLIPEWKLTIHPVQVSGRTPWLRQRESGFPS